MKILRNALAAVAAVALIASLSACGDDDAGHTGADTAGSTDDAGGGGDTTAPPEDAGGVPDVGSSGDGGGEEDVDLLGDGGTTDGGEDAGADATTEPDIGGTGTDDTLPNAELVLKIIGIPGQEMGASHIATLSGVIRVGGLVLGEHDNVTWQLVGGASGEAEGFPFFHTPPIALEPGPNRVVVTAHGEETATDELLIIYTPLFQFGRDPTVKPDALFVDESAKLVVTAPVTSNTAASAGAMEVWRVDGDGNVLSAAPLATLVDNGDLSQCDEISEDGVFSACINNVTCETDEDFYLAVSTNIVTDVLSYTAYSAPVRVECAQRIAKAECTGAHDTLQEARTQWQAAGGADDPNAARDATIAWLKAQAGVADAGPASGGGNGVWVQFSAGFLGALDLSPEGFRGAGPAGSAIMHALGGAARAEPVFNVSKISSKKALVMAPHHADLSSGDGGDEADAIAQALRDSACPTFAVDGVLMDGQATLSQLRQQYLYGIVAITGHGDAYFRDMADEVKATLDWDHHRGSQEVLWTGESVQCNALSSTTSSCSGPGTCPGGQECVVTGAVGAALSGVCVDRTQFDLRKGRVVMGASRWGMTGPFVARYVPRRYPDSLVYLGACRTMYAGTLAAAYVAAGAKAVLGYNGYVHSAFAAQAGETFFDEVTQAGELSGGAFFSTPKQDPEPPGARMLLLGADNLDIMDASLINPSWETGDLTGWRRDGDGRVISKLGPAFPVSGKFMGIVSTGLGFTVQTGEIAQDFCIPEDKKEIAFYWKFYSEEFKEYCGSVYQDTFQATLSNNAGQITLVNAKIDDLCHYEDGNCPPCPDPGVGVCGCGSQYVGLIPCIPTFDVGGVFCTQWQLREADVTPLAGAGPVELKFFATDQGDSIYDTAILIDAISFK